MDPVSTAIPGRSSNADNPHDLYKFTGHERDRAAIAVAGQLRQTGTRGQRNLATVQWLHMNLGVMSNPEILQRLEELQAGEPSAAVEREALHLKALVLDEYGLPEQAGQVLEELKRKHPDSRRAHQAERRLERKHGRNQSNQ